MKVKQLKIRSFRGIENLNLDFAPQVPLIIVGNNGVGKSSILDAFATLFKRLIYWIKSPLYDTEMMCHIEQSSMNYLSDNDITTGHHQAQLEITISLPKLSDLTWSITRVRQKNNKQLGENLTEFRQLTQFLYQQWTKNANTNIPIVVYYPVNRAVLEIPLEIQEPYFFDQMDAYEQALEGIKISFSRFFQWFRTVEDIENEERRDNSDYRERHLESVRQAIYSLMPDLSNLRIRRSPLRMTINKKGHELTINQLSNGERCLLAMVGDLAQRLAIANPRLKNPLEGSGIVLIDEIELHLHPQMQQEIIPRLSQTFPHCQFLMTTHSPLVVSHIPSQGVYCLKETPNGIIVLNTESSMGKSREEILQELMEVSPRGKKTKE